jgi:hypothetical protein|tara:strand:+ start:412 stop:768 length:357 start_codon:yes stop_codon:yes gene_type:complete
MLKTESIQKMANFDFCDEAYTVEKIVEVVVTLNGKDESSTLRLEVLKDVLSGKYSVHCYEKEHFHLQPSYPQIKGKFATQDGDFEVWTPLTPALPWVDRNTADSALQQALGFLKERCK